MTEKNYPSTQNEQDQQELVLRAMFRAPACDECGETELPLASNGLCGYCCAVEGNLAGDDPADFQFIAESI